MSVATHHGPARATDPETSKVAHITEHGHSLRWTVLAILGNHGPLTDDQLRYEHLPVSSHSGPPSRRKELVRLGLVATAGETLNERSRRCNLWKLTPAGVEMLAHGNEATLTAAQRAAEATRLKQGGNSHPAVADIRRLYVEFRDERNVAMSALGTLVTAAYAKDSRAFNEALRAARTIIDGGDPTT